MQRKMQETTSEKCTKTVRKEELKPVLHNQVQFIIFYCTNVLKRLDVIYHVNNMLESWQDLKF
jgi:hypothetical protein